LIVAAAPAWHPAMAADLVTLYAAGSLKAALTDVATAYEQAYGTPVATEFAASGLLRERIEDGAPVDVFASANMAHPAALAAAGWGGPVALFARNQLCALARAEVELSPATLLDVILDPDVRLGTSTPKADPSGDYAWQLFEQAEALALLRWRINVLSLGDEEARALGINAARLRIVVIVAATLMTASVVAIAGVIGWVGLIMPHMARMILGPNFERLMPAAMILGAGYLLLVDTLARTIAAVETPIGILTAFVGAPVFLWLLARGRTGW
jgi:molybdenum ABC transporter molybdate-binding protein